MDHKKKAPQLTDHQVRTQVKQRLTPAYNTTKQKSGASSQTVQAVATLIHTKNAYH